MCDTPTNMFYYEETLDSDHEQSDFAYQRSLSDDCLHPAMSCGIIHSNSSSFPQSWLLRSESVHSFERFQSMFPKSDASYHDSDWDITTLEDIKSQINSCYTCGVCWADGHVSLDCKECGSYSLERPCMLCDGQCAQKWQRDLVKSHDTHKATWVGECSLSLQEGESFLSEEVLVQGVEDLSTSS